MSLHFFFLFSPHNLLRVKNFLTLKNFAVRQHYEKLLKMHFSFFPRDYFSSMAIPRFCLLKEIKSRLLVITLPKLHPSPMEAAWLSIAAALPGRAPGFQAPSQHRPAWPRANHSVPQCPCLVRGSNGGTFVT